jgi:hypothetical protein
MVMPGFVIITILTWFVRPELLEGIGGRPLTWMTLLICVTRACAILTGLCRQRERLTFLGSSFLLF